MAETNSDAPAADDSKPTTEDDIRAIKYPEDGVETPKEADEPTDGDEDKEEPKADAEESKEDSDDGESNDEPQFVKKFSNIKGDTPEEYAKNLEAAYENSTAEFHKLRQSTPAKTDDDEDADDDQPTSDPLLLYTKQKMDEEIGEAFKDFSSRFTQVQDPEEYNRFVEEVKVLSQTIYTSQKRLAPPKELYAKAAIVLGWEPQDKVTDKERLDNAIKDTASNSKSASGTSKKVNKSKVTDAQIAAHRAMYPDKTDAQIREDLEPYVN